MTAFGNRPDTISLIGMPGAGKSTVGVVLAKLSGLGFRDTDLDIQVREHATLQEILERDGYRSLRRIEQEVVLATALAGFVIATGGSVVYSEPAMQRLKAAGPVVYLAVDLGTLEQRVAAAPLRGIASAPGDSYAHVYAERTPRYQAFADITVDAAGGAPEAVALDILEQLAGT